MVTRIAKLNAELNDMLETALRKVDPATPNSNINTTLVVADPGIVSETVAVQHNDNMLQNIIRQIHPISQRMLLQTNLGHCDGFRMRSRCNTKALRRLAQLSNYTQQCDHTEIAQFSKLPAPDQARRQCSMKATSDSVVSQNDSDEECDEWIANDDALSHCSR